MKNSIKILLFFPLIIILVGCDFFPTKDPYAGTPYEGMSETELLAEIERENNEPETEAQMDAIAEYEEQQCRQKGYKNCEEMYANPNWEPGAIPSSSSSSSNSSNSSNCSFSDQNFIKSKMKEMDRDVVSIQIIRERVYQVQYLDWSRGTSRSGSQVLDYSNNGPCD